MRYSVALVLLLTTSLHADKFTNGLNGINAGGLRLPNGEPLDGGGIGVGQIEPTRPGDPDVDIAEDHHHDAVDPFRVFIMTNFIDTVAEGGDDGEGQIHPYNDHATSVASIIIGDGKVNEFTHEAIEGVAPAAVLSAASLQPTTTIVSMIATIHNIATLMGPETWVMNHSHDMPLTAGAVPDGNGPVTKYIDWSATQHDILYVVGQPELGASGPALADNFNGITVVGSWRLADPTPYYQVGFQNSFGVGTDAHGPRVSADIMAPGEGVITALRATIRT